MGRPRNLRPRARRACLGAGVLSTALLAVAVLAGPLPAAAQDAAPAARGGISVTPRLEGCSRIDGRIHCEVAIGFQPVAGASHYTASVTAPDGAVRDFGVVPEGSASVWVPYSVPGDYEVSVSAWGLAGDEPLAGGAGAAGAGT